MLHIVHHITCTTPFSGLLVYFSDGMLPLLKSFYADFFNPTGGGSDRRRWMRVSSDILTALLVSFFYCSCMTSCLWGRCTLSQARVLAPWERIKCILTWHDVLIFICKYSPPPIHKHTASLWLSGTVFHNRFSSETLPYHSSDHHAQRTWWNTSGGPGVPILGWKIPLWN